MPALASEIMFSYENPIKIFFYIHTLINTCVHFTSKVLWCQTFRDFLTVVSQLLVHQQILNSGLIFIAVKSFSFIYK